MVDEAMEVDQTQASRPLSYESLKCVLEYMDANQRFFISHRMPSIRTAEKVVPLRINSLEFQETSVTVNGIQYYLGVYREFHEGHHPPTRVREQNAEGGVQHDIDEFGQRDPDGELTPGDISLQYSEQTPKLSREQCQARLEEIHRSRGFFSRNSFWRRKYHASNIFDVVHCARNKLPPYTAYIQLTQTVSSRTQNVLTKIPYSLKLHEAMKNLNTNFFGNRKNIFVRRFQIEIYDFVLRLPSETKFHVQNLTLGGHIDETFDRIRPVFHKDSIPFCALEVIQFHYGEMRLQNEILLNEVRKIVIFEADDALALWAVIDDPQSIIHVVHDDGHWPIFEYQRLIRLWQWDSQKIGNQVSFLIENDGPRVWNLMKNLKIEFEVLGERCLAVPINYSSKIRITLEEMDPTRYESYNRNWIMKFEVVAV